MQLGCGMVSRQVTEQGRCCVWFRFWTSPACKPGTVAGAVHLAAGALGAGRPIGRVEGRRVLLSPVLVKKMQQNRRLPEHHGGRMSVSGSRDAVLDDLLAQVLAQPQLTAALRVEQRHRRAEVSPLFSLYFRTLVAFSQRNCGFVCVVRKPRSHVSRA